VIFGLVFTVALAWIYTLADAGMQRMDMGGGEMPMRLEWTAAYATLVFTMWAVMMVAMMLPGAAPTILRVARLAHQRSEGIEGIPAALAFTAGYLSIWMGFSFAATLAQWTLDSADLLLDTMALRSGVATGALVIGIGLYQLSPLKRSCLARCSALSGRVAADQHLSARAIAWLGMRYGMSCLGCCWVLMLLLFVGGLMNVLWIAAIALLVIAEKNLPWGSRIALLAGAGLIAWGGVSLTTAAL